MIYEPRARALTEAPETLKAFLKQRFRWMFGTLQVACKNLITPRGMPLRIALITIPNVFLFSFAFTLLAPIVDAMLIMTLVTSVIGLWAKAARFISKRSSRIGSLLGLVPDSRCDGGVSGDPLGQRSLEFRVAPVDPGAAFHLPPAALLGRVPCPVRRNQGSVRRVGESFCEPAASVCPQRVDLGEHVFLKATS